MPDSPIAAIELHHIALPTRRPRFMPGVLIRLDERRTPRRRPGLSPKIKWFVVGSGATLLLLFFVKLILA